jgi:hypothetical protein
MNKERTNRKHRKAPIRLWPYEMRISSAKKDVLSFMEMSRAKGSYDNGRMFDARKEAINLVKMLLLFMEKNKNRRFYVDRNVMQLAAELYGKCQDEARRRYGRFFNFEETVMQDVELAYDLGKGGYEVTYDELLDPAWRSELYTIRDELRLNPVRTAERDERSQHLHERKFGVEMTQALGDARKDFST